MIPLFKLNNYNIDMSSFDNHLHGSVVDDFISEFCSYVGAKYGCALNSATNAIFLSLENKKCNIKIPSIIPPVVLNAIHNAGNSYEFVDNISWVGHSYTLHDFGDYKIIDSAQRVDQNQFAEELNPQDLAIFSFYPTKPVGGIDGGIIVSNDKDKIDYFKQRSLNGMIYARDNWDRTSVSFGWKMYMNSAQAYVALQNLRKLNEKKKQLSFVKNRYNEFFEKNNTSDHLYRINVEDRDSVLITLKNLHISCGIHYKALHLDSFFKNGQILNLSAEEGRTTLSIPFNEGLTEEQQEYIIKCLSKI